MKEYDYNDFAKAIKLSYVLVNIDTPADEVIRVMFNMFIQYPKELVMAAIDFHTKVSVYAIKPADITQYIELKMGLQEETLRNEAYNFFNKYLANAPQRCDVVIEDIKMAKAFYDCFTDFESFTKNDKNRKMNDSQEFYDCKRFVDTVVANKMNFDFESVPRVFKGFRNFPKIINVCFIGNYDNCKTLADQYYEPIIKEQQIIVQYPVDPNRRIENKNNGKSKELTDEERKESVKTMDNVLKEIANNCIIHDKKKKH